MARIVEIKAVTAQVLLTNKKRAEALRLACGGPPCSLRLPPCVYSYLLSTILFRLSLSSASMLTSPRQLPAYRGLIYPATCRDVRRKVVGMAGFKA